MIVRKDGNDDEEQATWRLLAKERDDSTPSEENDTGSTPTVTFKLANAVKVGLDAHEPPHCSTASSLQPMPKPGYVSGRAAEPTHHSHKQTTDSTCRARRKKATKPTDR